MYRNIKFVAFDADDTLWVFEPFFREIESKFCELLQDYLPEKQITGKLFDVEIKNLHIYGYGVKGFILSLIQTAIEISNKSVETEIIEEIINMGKGLLNRKITLLDNVENTIKEVKDRGYQLIVATKGDLLDQNRKLISSGLEKYFHHIEVMSDKKTSDYCKLIKRLEIHPSEFLMVGNSLKSDILPVVDMGGKAIHIPFHTTWDHEKVPESQLQNKKFDTVNSIIEILNFL
ncbi:MAG: HAD family hydrolase [Bacteroidales bacterium]|nr:HAD family hydrolase [Bacteroidales bacterium]